MTCRIILKTKYLIRCSLLRFNTAPLGAVHSGGAGDLFPPYTQRFLSEIFDTPQLAAGRFIIKDFPCEYIGIDVAESVIGANKKRYADIRLKIQFMNIDSLSYLKNTRDKEFDLILIRHTLEHLPTWYNIVLLEEIKRCSKYAFITSTKITTARTNQDCDFGGYHPVDLLKPPYSELLKDGLLLEEIDDHVKDSSVGVIFMNFYEFS